MKYLLIISLILVKLFKFSIAEIWFPPKLRIESFIILSIPFILEILFSLKSNFSKLFKRKVPRVPGFKCLFSRDLIVANKAYTIFQNQVFLYTLLKPQYLRCFLCLAQVFWQTSQGSSKVRYHRILFFYKFGRLECTTGFKEIQSDIEKR